MLRGLHFGGVILFFAYTRKSIIRGKSGGCAQSGRAVNASKKYKQKNNCKESYRDKMLQVIKKKCFVFVFLFC
ncbi:hypothetical protein [uncultured Phascolarctobacterium sp.]|jgi:hypothetical protein|uniref:hypothetical protein n=1 Tax=uncultured Phascolarctobacterium sp. TaxID=512296 RepID=UPI0025DC5AB9|nr:hypothetical protein [uncultured Phascolarctobacterium sp.]